MKKISVIVPCYQNQGSIAPLAQQLLALRERLADKAEMGFVFVNDGSTDGTLEAILTFKNAWPDLVKVVNLTRNFGSYNAFLAGMSHSRGDCHVYLHADLQDPPELIDEMFGHYLNGNRLVIAYRQAREDGSIFSTLYHVMVKRYAIRNIPPGGFDLMLFDDTIRKEVLAISEKNTNIVYLISWLGYPYMAIPYTRRKREHGTSQWKFWKKVRLFVNTFFSFSDYPLFLLRGLCLLSIVSSLALLGVLVYAWLQHEPAFLLVMGLCLAVLLLVVGVTTGIMAEYLSRIHETVRKRPNFVVEQII